MYPLTQSCIKLLQSTQGINTLTATSFKHKDHHQSTIYEF